MKTLCMLSCVALLAAACGGDDDGNGDTPDAAAGMPDAAPGDPDSGPPACDPSAAGTICTIIGSGENGYAGDDGSALAASLSLPQDVLAMSDGSLLVLDWNNHRIRKWTTDGVLHHVAGRGELGGTLDDPANSDLNHPTGMLLNADESKLYVAAWHNSKIRVIDLASATLDITDVAGDGRRAYFDTATALGSTLDLPTSLVWDASDNIVFMDQANQVIRKLDLTANTVSRVAGQCVVEPTFAGVKTFCADGEVPLSCTAPNGKSYCGGNAAACMQPCTPSYTAGTTAMDFRMSQPFGQSADPGGRMVMNGAGDLYFAEPTNHIIRKIAADGTVSVVAGTVPVAGVAQKGTSPDGTDATSALLNRPVDLALAEDGTLYFSDVYNNCVRKVAPDGKVYTVVGVCGERGYDGDGGAPTAAHLKLPYGVELAGSKLYVSDTGNMVVRVVNL